MASLMDEIHEWEKDGYVLSTDRDRLDFDVIHDFLTHSYWSPGIPRHVVEKGASNSLVFGLYHAGGQVGFARMVTDFARFAYLADVFVLPDHRGHGLGKWMVECILACPTLSDVSSVMLATRDAHGLYEQFGFQLRENNGNLMSRRGEPPTWHDESLIRE